MTDWLLALVPTYGPWLLLVCTYLATIALPVPASMLLLAAGGFVAAGDLALTASAGAALGGAVAGDQTLYVLGRTGGAGLIERMGQRAAPVARGRDMLARRGDAAVFLSRWLVSPLGPWVTLAAGAAGLGWLRFSLWAVAGQVIWVALYIGLGYGFTGNLAAASSAALKALALIGLLGVVIVLAVWLVHKLRGAPAAGQ
jgi:membrane-associated protein